MNSIGANDPIASERNALNYARSSFTVLYFKFDSIIDCGKLISNQMEKDANSTDKRLFDFGSMSNELWLI